MKNRLRKLLCAGLCAAMLGSLLPAALASEGDTTLTIIATSDTHGNVWGYSYEDNKESSKDGLARISTYVNSLREAGENVILVDAGDTIQGTILTDDVCNPNPDEPHPVMAAMNYMQYDAMGLGNHEFNWGVTSLQKILGQAEFPVLCANIKDEKGEYVAPGGAWTIVERAGIKVAIIGVDTPNIQRWDGGKDGIDSLQITSLADGVKAALAEIGDQADVVMVAAHAGPTAEYSTDGSDAANSILELPGVDVLQCGHSHSSYINNDGPVPVGEVKNGAGEVLRYTVTVDGNKNVTSAKVETVSMAGIEPDEGLREDSVVKAAHEKTVSFVNDNILGHASAKFQPENEIRGIPAGRIMDTAVMDLIGNVQLAYSGADVTGAALFKDTSDLPAGELNYGNIFDIYKYDNKLRTVEVTGAELKAYMEWAAECYNSWKSGDVTISFNPNKAGYLHDHFTGVNYEINLSKDAGERIENVTFQGKPLTSDMTLKLCVNDYRYSGLKTAGIISGEYDWESSQSVRDMLKEYMSKVDPITPEVDNNWKITGVELQLDNPQRAAYIEKINSGELAAPYNKSVNLNEANNVVVDGLLNSADSVTADGKTAFRLRDLALILKGTDQAFSVDWNGQVVITKGGEYTGAALAPHAQGQAVSVGKIDVLVDGAPVSVDVLLAGGNYYVTAEGANALLALNATQADGVLTFSAKDTGASGQGG